MVQYFTQLLKWTWYIKITEILLTCIPFLFFLVYFFINDPHAKSAWQNEREDPPVTWKFLLNITRLSHRWCAWKTKNNNLSKLSVWLVESVTPWMLWRSQWDQFHNDTARLCRFWFLNLLFPIMPQNI